MTVLERFNSKIEKTDGCWIWRGSRDTAGYGRFGIKYGRFSAHRLAYQYFTGKAIPPGLTLDHLCRNRLCVNPSHLEVVTMAENLHRGKPLHQTHCKHGHEYTPENTLRDRHGHRHCLACRRISNAKRRN